MVSNGETLAAAIQAVRLDPSSADAWQSLAYLLLSQKKWHEAAQTLELATTAVPKNALLMSYYAMALVKIGELERAHKQAQAALNLAPNLNEALLASIEVLSEAGYYDLALLNGEKLKDDAIRETALFSQGSLAFLTGEQTRGMRLLTKVINSGWRGPDIPEWDGKPVPERHIVLYSGQGFGDMIQFVRYLPYALAHAGKVTLLSPPNIAHVMRDSFPEIPIITDSADLPDDVSLRCSLPSLTNFVAESFNPWAQSVPYLRPDHALASKWRERIGPIPYPRIGLAWSSPLKRNDPFRSVGLETLQPLIDIAKPHLVSLQLGAEAEQARQAGIFDPSSVTGGFEDSAALINELDLIITMDSAPAHLAGALGKPVWVFMPFNGEWRWMIGREDSIWYPTMRLFRQKRPKDWPEVIARLCTDAGLFIAGDRNVLVPRPWDGITLRRHPHPVFLNP